MNRNYIIASLIILLFNYSFSQDISKINGLDTSWARISENANDKLRDSLKQTYIIYLVDNYKYEKAEKLIKSYANSYDGLKNPAFAFYVKGELFTSSGQFDSAFAALHKAKELYLKEKDLHHLSTVYYKLAQTCTYQKRLVLATDYILKAIKITQPFNDKKTLNVYKFELAQNYLRQKDPLKAKAYLYECLKYTLENKDQHGASIVYNLLTSVYISSNQLDSAIYFNNKSSQISKELKDSIGMAFSNFRLAEIAKKEQNYLIALKYFTDYYNSCVKWNDKKRFPTLLQNMVDCYLHLNNYEAANKYLNESLKFANQNKDIQAIFFGYKYRAELAILKNDYKSAYENKEKYYTIKDSINSLELKSQQKELLIKYDSELKDGEIEILRLEKENEKQSKYIYLFSMVGFVLIAGMFLSLMILRHRKNKQLYNEQVKLSNANKLIADNEINHLRQKLEFNQKELNDYTQNLVQRNNLIDELENKLKEFSLLEEKLVLERDKKIEELWRLKILTDEDWEKFRSYIENVHPGLTSKIKHTYEDITVAELRLFLMQKLKMGTKEIASLLGISATSVTKTKYRLKKKLELKEEDSLDEFISKF